MSHLPPFVLCLTGFALLALATDRQQRDLIRRPLSSPVVSALRLAASCLLVVALSLLVYWHGGGLGLVMFSGHTSLGAGIVYCVLIGYSRRRALSSRYS